MEPSRSEPPNISADRLRATRPRAIRVAHINTLRMWSKMSLLIAWTLASRGFRCSGLAFSGAARLGNISISEMQREAQLRALREDVVPKLTSAAALFVVGIKPAISGLNGTPFGEAPRQHRLSLPGKF